MLKEKNYSEAYKRKLAREHVRYLVKKYGKEEGERLATLSPEEFKVVAKAHRREVALVKMNTPEVVAKLKAAHINRSDEDQALRSKRLSVALLGHYEDPEAREVTRKAALKWHSEETSEHRAAMGRKVGRTQRQFSKGERTRYKKSRSIAQLKRFASMTKEEKEVHKRKQAVGYTPEVRERIRTAATKNWEAGLYDDRAVATKAFFYKGIKFRSSWEAWTAEQLDILGISWEHEPVRFKTSLGSYTPDFYLSDSDEYLEVKSAYYESDTQKAKIEELRHTGHVIHYLVDAAIGGWLQQRNTE